jgi:predicted glycoside hydrolase/deacetylase ChbG (UPF0249 family)
VRRLIINADDFGLTAGVNRGILVAHEQGVLTSATLMANGPAFEEAIRAAQSVPTLDIGCHVVLLDGTPLLPASRNASLLRKATGKTKHHYRRFRDSITGFAARALAGRLNPDHIEAEATAQIQKLQSAGVTVSHFDTHKHTHMFPAVLWPLLRAAKNCGVHALRNPFPPFRALPEGAVLSRPGLWKRYAQVKALRGFAASFHKLVQDHRLATTDGTIGVVVTGVLDAQLFARILENLPDGTWEFVCHPGYNDADLEAVNTRLRESRRRELEALTSAAVKKALSRHNIQLISFRDLVGEAFNTAPSTVRIGPDQLPQ